MKKLTNTVLLACTFALLLISCSKDPVLVNRPQEPDQPPPEDVPSVIISGSSADLSLYVYSSPPPATSYHISIAGLLAEEFNIQSGPGKTWQLRNLLPGTHRVTISWRESNFPLYYAAFRFEIANSNGIQNLTAGPLGPRIYGFDLHVKN